MKRYSKIFGFIALVLFGFSLFAAATYPDNNNSSGTSMMPDMGKVTVTAPKNNQAFTSGTVTVSWQLELGKEGHHVHFYLDGKLLGPKYGNSFTLKDLKSGMHHVELRLATKNHKELGPKADVMFTVKG